MTTIKVSQELVKRLKEVRQANEQSHEATLRRLVELPVQTFKKRGPKPMLTLPCEVCGQPITPSGDGLGTCPSCQTTAPLIIVTDQKATIIIKQFLEQHQNNPITTQNVSNATGISTSQVEQIMDRLSR